MQKHIDTTHKRLGELAVMAHQTEVAERRILERAEAQMAKVEKDLPTAAGSAMTSGADAYMDLIAERGRLQQVIAQARATLSTTRSQ